MNHESDSSYRQDLRARGNEDLQSWSDSRIQNWHSDYGLTSPQAREWHAQNKQSHNQSNFSGRGNAEPIGDRQRQEVGRLAQDLLQGNLRDATQVLNDLIRHPNQVRYNIQQANQLVDNAARQHGYKSPAHVAIWQDGRVSIVDQYERPMVQVGNIYGQNAYAPLSTNGISNYAPERYSGLPQRSNSIAIGNYASDRYSFLPPQSNSQSNSNGMSSYASDRYSGSPQQSNSHAWRATYGVSGSLASTLQNSNDQLRYDVQNVTPEGRWRPNSNNTRSWKDRFDDPGMNQQLDALRQNGFSNVFGRPNA